MSDDLDNTRFYALPVYEEPEAVRLRTWVQLAHTFYRIERSIAAALAEKELTMAQFDVLATLRYSQGLTQKELAETLLVTKGNVVGLLDRLQKLDLVERRVDPEDGRSNRVYLTKAGNLKIEGVLPERLGNAGPETHATVLRRGGRPVAETFPSGAARPQHVGHESHHGGHIIAKSVPVFQRGRSPGLRRVTSRVKSCTIARHSRGGQT